MLSLIVVVSDVVRSFYSSRRQRLHTRRGGGSAPGRLAAPAPSRCPSCLGWRIRPRRLATALIISRGHIPAFWSITFANMALACGYGLLWSGARLFDGRRVMPIVALLGAGLWLVTYPLPEVHADATYRAVLMAMIGTFYTMAAAFELWRDRNDNLRYRRPVICLLILHAAAVLLRIPLAGAELTSIEITELALVRDVRNRAPQHVLRLLAARDG